MAASRFPVEAGHIMMFARAIGDPNPAYDPSADRADDAPVIAPPTFTMASAQFDPEYTLRPRAGEPWFGSASGPGFRRDGHRGGLHAEQHFEYHRPLRAGQTLTVTHREGDTWEKESRRGGTLRFSEQITEYHDADTGELVVTARMVGVITS